MHIWNNKVISLILGSPGSGKSTMAAMLVALANKKGVPVYCNYPVLGAYMVDMNDVIKRDLGESVLIIDEAGLHYNSRQSKGNSKDFTPAHYHWFATTRHRKTQLFIIVQNWGRVDIVLRQLATEVIMCRKGFFGFTTIKVYNEQVKLLEDKEGNATDFLEVFFKIRWRCFWRPSYYHMFDSFHLDKEYLREAPVLYPADHFPKRQPLWRRLLGLFWHPPKRKPKARQRAAGRKRAAIASFFKSLLGGSQ